MSDVASITLTGMDDLQRKLQSLGANVPKELTTAGLKAMKLNVEAAAKVKCRDQTYDNGELTKKIDTQEAFENGRAVIKTGTNVTYAPYIEYGTGIYATGPGGSRAKRIPWLWTVKGKKWPAILGVEDGERVLWWGSRPHPFLRPAFDENKDRVIEDVKAELEKAIARYSQ